MESNLAIVIPYYKIDFFKETLDALANQTNKNFKVYIGNDASPNNPKALLENYKNVLDFEYFEFKDNLGGQSLVQQWHRCINLTKNEEWLMILCDDDALTENYIAEFYNNLTEINTLKIDVVRFASQVVDGNNNLLSEIITHPKIENSIDFLFRKFKGGTRSTLSEYIFKRNHVITIQFKNLPLAWYSDLLGVIEFSKLKNIFTINDALLKFRLSGINITSKTEDQVIKNVATFQFYHYLLKHLGSHFSKEQKNILHSKIEKTLLDNKKNVNLWLKTLHLYATNGRFFQFVVLFFKAIKRIV